ncbi:pilus assembly protein TadE [Streptomyces clavuligerus]|uniref:TadE-like domain-containing protein n=2 Tax=Streptomyces clavuligerus TaxID=1901 RepID=E2Q9N9_STRCL|nr:Hypothetical protein SCLAV_2544 [Streptomyces clavuligerus]QCS06950.1 pilus assembly protein TadE [Streptomyces clavuligerus]
MGGRPPPRRRAAGAVAGTRPGSGGRRDGCRDGGMVTAETAVAMPALVLFTMALVWALTAVLAQIQCVDAARAGARAAARSEPYAEAVGAARSAAPAGARIDLVRVGRLWRVRVSAPAPGTGSWGLTVRAEAVALAEDTAGLHQGGWDR